MKTISITIKGVRYTFYLTANELQIYENSIRRFEGMFVQDDFLIYFPHKEVPPGCKPTLRNFLGWKNYGKVIRAIEQLKNSKENA